MSIFDQVASIGVVPVIALDDARYALPLADALADGGLKVIGLPFAPMPPWTPSARLRGIARKCSSVQEQC